MIFCAEQQKSLEQPLNFFGFFSPKILHQKHKDLLTFDSLYLLKKP